MPRFPRTEAAYSSRRLTKDLLGGITATVTMSAFQTAWNTAAEARSRNSSVGREPTDTEGATELVGRAADILGINMSAEKRRRAGIFSHYLFGIGMGVVYGLIRSAVSPSVRRWNAAIAGGAFGTTIFFLANELIMPRLGVPNNGSRSPLGSHPYALASHLIYGLTLGAVHNLTE